MQALTQFQKAHKKKKTRPLGGHSNEQWAAINRDTIVHQHHLGGASLEGAHGRAEAESEQELVNKIRQKMESLNAY